MDQLLSTHPNSLFLICGDFNCHQASWLGVGTTLSCHGTSAKDFCDSLRLTQSVKFQTRISTNGTTSLLDHILTNFPENICCSSSTPIGSYDHMLNKVDISVAGMMSATMFVAYMRLITKYKNIVSIYVCLFSVWCQIFAWRRSKSHEEGHLVRSYLSTCTPQYLNFIEAGCAHCSENPRQQP